MANKEHIEVVLQGAESIDEWREKNPGVRLDLSGANLRRASLEHANLSDAILTQANLEWADLRWADLMNSDLTEALLSRADLHKTDMAGANLSIADLADTNFEDANCQSVIFDATVFSHTRLLCTDFRNAKGLEKAITHGPSFLDAETITKSGHLPKVFLRGCGINEAAIQASYHENVEVIAQRLESGGKYYSCFISYSTKNSEFVERLYHDLQESDVRCWFAPYDLKIGERTLDSIYSAIRQREKLIVVLSEQSIDSYWVREEVEKALAEERDRGDTVIFPIRIDDEVMNCTMAWAELLKNTRQIGNFCNWDKQENYNRTFERLLRDLQNNEHLDEDA